MASYNGQKYIKEQIDSICNQSIKNWCLFIRDDGSVDDTIQIIQKYCKQDKRIHLLCNNTDNHGAYLNFWTLIDFAKNNYCFDYCFFADQDDIWPQNKLEIMLTYANKFNADIPLLVYGDMEIINENNEVMEHSLNDIMGIGKMSGLTEFYSSGFVWGCNMMINRKLIDVIDAFPINHPVVNIMSHDNYYTKVCLITGKVVFLDHICLLHRRHINNVTSGNVLRLSFKEVIKKTILGFDKLCKTHAIGYVQTLYTLMMMRRKGIITDHTKLIETAIIKGGLTGVKIMLSQHVKRKQLIRTIGVYLVMLFNSYQKPLMKLINKDLYEYSDIIGNI